MFYTDDSPLIESCFLVPGSNERTRRERQRQGKLEQNSPHHMPIFSKQLLIVRFHVVFRTSRVSFMGQLILTTPLLTLQVPDEKTFLSESKTTSG